MPIIIAIIYPTPTLALPLKGREQSSSPFKDKDTLEAEQEDTRGLGEI
jgi:hypothetical protein